jgi:hypothetical protein
MAQMNHYTTQESEIALQEVKLFLIKRGFKPTNKVELLNQATIICAKLLTNLDEETLENVLLWKKENAVNL